MWCVALRPDGTFRSARRGPVDPYAETVTVMSLAAWRSIDPVAADQFVSLAARARAERDERVQRAFMRVSGLDQSAVLRQSLTATYAGAWSTTTTSLGGTSAATHHPRPQP